MNENRTAMHPTDTGPGWVDADGYSARIMFCPECGQLEWWTDREIADHGQCRATGGKCPVCGEIAEDGEKDK